MSDSPRTRPSQSPVPAWQAALRWFFSRLSVELSIGVLVLISIALTLFELAIEVRLRTDEGLVIPGWGAFGPGDLERVMAINDGITLIFIIELTLRFFAAASKRRFFGEFWLDILSVIPLFRVFRSARALRFLRLFRVVRLLGVVSRVSSHYPHILRRGAFEFLVVCGFLFVAILFGTAAMTYFERAAESDRPPDIGAVEGPAFESDPENDPFSMERSFWFSVYTLFAGEPIPNVPRTLIGKIISVFLMFMGLTIFAIIAGTVSAFMTDRIRLEGHNVKWDDLSNHIIICGWTPKTPTIISEYRANRKTRQTPIVVITELDRDRIDASALETPQLFLIHDDFTRVAALERAGIARAQTCLVLADLTGGRSEQDADARTILAALTVEKMNPDVYTCAELIHRSYSTHLELGKVNNYVISEEYGAFMLAQASMHHGLVRVMNELLSYQHGNEFYRARLPGSWAGRSFEEVLAHLKANYDAILVGVHPENGEMVVNPRGYKFQQGDEIVAICETELQLGEWAVA